LSKNQQPIAIVGMACRFPGGCINTDQYWELLRNGTDVVTEIRPDRWSKEFYYHPDPKSSGKTYTAAAGQLDDIYQFDPEFFGITPREAAQMDPQQRLLLQMSWEALEDGGVRPKDIAGTNSSVYIGISSLDYANNRMDDPNVADAYFMTGNTLSIAANRISYVFDLHGPSMTIDTACSSSLVALHQACSSIWSGESCASIVGAVHLVLSPFPFIGFSKASMLSRQGRCRVFDASADGYVRSEGGVVLYLKPLDQALADNNRIHAVIRGTAVNSDGNTSAMTVPNGAAQAALLQNLYSNTGIDVNQIDYIEAHGTGTPVGDPIETAALGQAIGSVRSVSNPLLIGSVKTNIGHLEPASGFAGLLKVVLSLEHGAIPATIHQQRSNPQIDFNGLNLSVVDSYTRLNVSDRPLLMGVNSFGFGGTNAHTILEQYRPPVMADVKRIIPDGLPPLVLSAMSEESLKSRAAQFNILLDQKLSHSQVYDIFYTAAFKRQKLKYGLVVCADSIANIRQALAEYLAGRKSVNLFRTEPVEQDGGVAWIFSGNGCQWAGMGRSLLGNSLFRHTIESIDTFFQPLAGWSLIAELEAEPDSSRLELTEIAQPLLFAVQTGIAALLQDLGLNADAVAGHSVGEIAAAYVSGALTLETAVRVIYFRSMAQGRTRGRGRMAAVRLSAERMQSHIHTCPGELEIAAINAAESVTISGTREAIRTVLDLLQEQAVTCRELDLDYAFHSRVMDEIAEYIQANLGKIEATTGNKVFASTVTGHIVSGALLDGQYWWRNIREPVQFSSAITALLDKGIRTFIEIGSHPVLQSYLRDTMQEAGIPGRVIRTLKRNDPDEYLSVKTAAYKTIFSMDTPHIGKIFSADGYIVSLPTYPWDNARYIFAGSNEAVNKQREHPLLGFRLNAVDGIWINQIDLQSHSYLADHVVDGVVIFPAAGFAEMALAASRSWFRRDAVGISDLEIRKPLILETGKTRVTQFQLSTSDLHFTIRSRDRLNDGAWIDHASGKLAATVTAGRHRSLDSARYTASSTAMVTAGEIYAAAAACGLDYGKKFRGAVSVLAEDNLSLTELQLPDASAYQTQEYLWHPVVMDSAFHSLFAVLRLQNRNVFKSAAYIPVAMNELRFYGRNAGPIVYSECSLDSCTDNLVRAGFTFYNGTGLAIAEIRDCVFRKLPVQDKSRNIPASYYYKLIPRNQINPYSLTPIPGTDVIMEKIALLPSRELLVANERLVNEQVAPLFDALASAIAEQTLRDFGAHLGHFTIESLLAASRIDSEFRTYISYLLVVLEQDGKAVCHDGQWKLLDSLDVDDPVAIWRSILADYPAYINVLRSTASNSFRIKDILTGNPENVGTQEIAARSISETQGQGCLQQALLRHIIKTLLAEWPKATRRLRIADVRSSQSSVISDLIMILPPDFCDYEVLALDELCASQSEELYKDCVNVSVSRFDPSRNTTQPKYREGEFDIVFVLDELHNCTSLGEMFTQITCLLASGGMLMLLEKKPDRITDMNRGLVNPGWWHRSTHADRPLSSNMYPEDWIYLLENSGFEDVRCPGESLVKGSNRYLMLARRPARQIKEPLKAVEQTSALLISAAEGYSIDLARALKSELSRQGIQTLLAPGPGRTAGRTESATLDLLGPDSPGRLAAIIDPHSTLPLKILYLSGLNDKPGELASADTAEQVSNCNMRLLNLIRSLASMELKSRPIIYIVTSGALGGISPGSASEPNPYQAGLWGVGRVICNEYPDIDCRMIDLQTATSIKNMSRLLVQEVIKASDGEEEVVILDSARMVVRLESAVMDSVSTTSSAASSYLTFARAGSIDNLEWQSNKRRLPMADEVEIEVRATGLNFRDIMFTSGLLPVEMLEGGHSGATLGLECSGVVTRVGSNVQNLVAGDEVMAMASSCFSSHVIASRYSVIRKPSDWSFEAAATIPTAFFTIYYSLHHMARLKPGERILVHGAAGGVGLAAIQYARYCGAEIFATAGTPEKRKFLELLGVDHVLSSRTQEFADQIMTITANQGVDVVLNSLAGEAMTRNFSVLRPFGRYIELGKRDFYENTRIDLKPFRNNISYFGIDADQLLAHEPELSHRLMSEVVTLFNEGVFRPLPYTAFPATDVQSAFRYMQQSRHIGKVVVTRNLDGMTVRDHAAHESLVLNPEASYLITGGMSGFGLATARWLAGKGARHLVLAGRNGPRSESADRIIEELLDQNIDVKMVQCDVTDAIRMQTVLNEIQSSAYPLKGIVHAAMVLEDAAIRNMDYSRMHNVIAPKVQGAWNLHRLTLNYPLDLFVLFSSATTCLGNPGQANYVSANTFLESLARFRRRSRLPATVVAWDAINDTGYLARNEVLASRLSKRAGLGGISSVQALNMLERLIVEGRTDTIIMNANWAALRQALPLLNSNLYRNIMHAISQDGEDGSEDMSDLLARLPDNEKQPVIVNFLIREIARILQTAEEKIGHNSTIQDLGIDSLMAMELASTIETRMEVSLPVMTLADNVTIDNLALRIVNLLNPSADPDASQMTRIVTSLAKIHAEDMSADEIESITRVVDSDVHKPLRLIQ